MIYVYAIQSLKDGRIYVGQTSNVTNRLAQHNKGLTFSTKPYTPWKLFYTETFNDRASARAKEKYLKSGIGKSYLKSLLQTGSNN